MKKYSIIVPIYNVEIELLKICVNSLINQSYRNIEIVLVNDGSNQEIKSYCDNIAKDDNRIKVIHKKNGGVSSARNAGIAKASGDYISFIDSDDYLELNTIELINNIANSDDIDIIKYGYIREKEKEWPIKISTKTNQIISNVDYESEVYAKLFNTKDYESACNAFYKLSLIMDNNILFDQSLKVTEDFLFNIHCIVKSSNIFFLDKYLYHYRVNPVSASQKYVKEEIIKHIRDEINSYTEAYGLLKSSESIIKDNCSKKLFKLIKNRLCLIALNEKYKTYIMSVDIVNGLIDSNNLYNLLKFKKFKNSYLTFFIYKLDIKLRSTVKKIIGI